MSSTITYESLYNMVRKEKTSEALQELSPEVYVQIVEYLQAKLEIYQNTEDKEKVKTQLQSARRLVKELYERRERKLLEIALNKSRTKSDAVDDAALLDVEKEITSAVKEILDSYRTDILLNLVNAKLPFKEKIKDNSLIRFTADVPQFLGPDMQKLGPFKEGDIANLPKSIAKVLLQKEVAKQIHH